MFISLLWDKQRLKGSFFRTEDEKISLYMLYSSSPTHNYHVIRIDHTSYVPFQT